MRGPAAVMVALVGSGCAAPATSGSTGPTAPPTIGFVDPAPGAPACRAIGTDVQARVPLLLAVGNVLLEPPEDWTACSSHSQCGWLRLIVDGVVNDEAAGKAIDLLAGKLANPYHDGSVNAATGQPDVLALEAHITIPYALAIDGNPIPGVAGPLLDQSGKPVSATAQLIIKPSCP